jgi:hypothetical protein
MPYIQLQFRRDTSTNWTSANPLLASGEMGIELDTRRFKIGDGCLNWNNLPYGGLQGPTGPAGGGGSGGTSATGATGATGVGVPSGGSSGQVLAKTSGANYATGWINPPASGVSSIVAGTNVTISPSNGLGAVTINASGGGGAGVYEGPYIIKITTLTSTSIGTLVSATYNGTPLTGWTITFPSVTSMQVVYPSSLTGIFTNFRRMTAINDTTPLNYYSGAIASGSTTGAYCQYNPGEKKIIFGAITSTQYGYSVANTPIYILFDYMSSALP